MAAIILPQRRYTQPQGRVQVDFSGRLFDPSLVSVLLFPAFSGNTDALSGETYTTGTTLSPITTNEKGVARVRWTLTNSLNVGDASAVFASNSCTIISATVRTSSSVTNAALHGRDGGANFRVLTHMPFTDNILYFDYGNATEGSGRIATNMASFLAAGTVNIWGLVAGGRGREIWRNGRRIANNAGSSATVPAGDVTAGIFAGTAGPLHTENLLFITKEQLSEAAMELLTASPYEMFRATTTRIYSLAAATIPTLSAPGVTEIGSTSVRPQITLTF